MKTKKIKINKNDKIIFDNYYEGMNDIYFKIAQSVELHDKGYVSLTEKQVKTVIKQLKEDSDNSRHFKSAIIRWENILKDNFFLMEDDFMESRDDFNDALEEVFYNIIEIGLADYGYPDAELMASNKWKKDLKNNFDDILNHTFEQVSDDDFDGVADLDWMDTIDDGILLMYPRHIEYFAELISNQLLKGGLYLIDVYLYFFSLLVKRAKGNRIPVEKMFKKVKDNLLEEFKKVKPKEFFEILSIKE